MHVWNLLYAARWKCRMQKWQKIAICAPLHNFVGLYLRNEGTYRQSEKKLVKQQYLLQMSLQYGELLPTSGWDLLAGLGHPIIFQRVSLLGSVTARQSSNGRQSNFAALNRGRATITLDIGPHSSCVLLGGFAIGAQVLLLWQHSAKCQRVLVFALCPV